MIDKQTVHHFGFWDGSSADITEYPLTSDGEGRLNVEFSNIEHFSFWENVDGKEAYFTFNKDDLFVKVSIKDSIYEQVLKELQNYARGRKRMEREKVK